MQKNTYLSSMMIMGTLFFFFGTISWVNSVLIPYFKVTCELSLSQAYLVGFVFYIAYLLFAIPSSSLLDKLGYKRGISVGLLVMALGSLVFIPAALTREYALFLTGLFLLGAGLTVLQTAGNPYVTVIGPLESAAKRMSIMGVCNKLAGILAPLALGYVIIRQGDTEIFDQINAGAQTINGMPREEVLDSVISRVIPPYVVLAIVFIVFAVVVGRSSLPEINKTGDKVAEEDSGRSILSYPYLILGIVAMICHLGTQALCINTLATTAESLGTDIAQAKLLPSMILFSTFIGFGLGAFLIPKVISQQKALKIAAITDLIASVLVIIVGGNTTFLGVSAHNAMWILVLMGIPNAFLYSGIWPLAIHDLGKHTSLGSAFLVMSLCASGIFPLIYAEVATALSDPQAAYWIAIPCFCFIVFYAFWGYKINSWTCRRDAA